MFLDKAFHSVSLTDVQANTVIRTNTSLLERKRLCLFSLAVHKEHSEDQHLSELE